MLSWRQMPCRPLRHVGGHVYATTTTSCEPRLHAFAEHGYDGMSLRTLNAEMGLSRGTINQRFGSKEQLWYAAVDHEFRQLIEDLNAELQQRMVPDDDLSRLREGIRAFLLASVRRPGTR